MDQPIDILSFDDLLQAARTQSRLQRLLFAFYRCGTPAYSTPVQRERFAAGQGGSASVPLMYVDKRPEELPWFAALV